MDQHHRKQKHHFTNDHAKKGNIVLKLSLLICGMLVSLLSLLVKINLIFKHELGMTNMDVEGVFSLVHIMRILCVQGKNIEQCHNPNS